ncbi:aldose 1-epimerase family protein [Alsobacter sp. R-9]
MDDGNSEAREAAGAGFVQLRHGHATATVSPEGAELRNWRIAGDDVLWSGDPAWWDGVAPVLFPVVGWTRNGAVRVGGTTYPLGLHGFARKRRFEVAAAEASTVTLRLRDDPATRDLYPFPFSLSVTYAVEDHALAATFTVTNTGLATMPYACGWHPGFRWPLPGGRREDQAIIFAEREEPRVPVIAPGGLFSARSRPVELDGRRLALREDTFADEALCFMGARSRRLLFGPGEGDGPRLEVEFDNLPNIVLWSRPGAPLLCIEGWSGQGDPEGYAGTLEDKPGMTLLPPGETARHGMRLRFRSAEE